MSGVVFRDVHGRTGYITEELEVDYHGEWDEEVERCVRRIEDEHARGGGDPLDGDVYNGLLIELPEEAPVVKAVRVSDTEPSA